MKYICMECIRCDLRFGIWHKHYNPDDTYTCPICGKEAMRPADRKKLFQPVKYSVGRPKNPYFNKTIIREE